MTGTALPGALEHALADITIGLDQHREARKTMLDTLGGREVEQQVRVPLVGNAGNEWGFVDKGVGFEMPFIWLPAQRGAPFRTPHFSYGIEHESGTDALIVIHASVVRWNINPSQRVLGARIRYAVSAPTTEPPETAPFSAVAHLTFQGWAGDLEEGEVS